jgi:hypothetical protein
MRRRILLTLALAFCSLLAFGENAKGGLIYGDSWAILVSAPELWVWDSVTLRHQGIWGLFYKEGTHYSPSALHIYISPTQKSADGPGDLAEFMKEDEATFMDSDAHVGVKDLSSYSPGLNYRYAMKDFDDADNCYYEAIAYYEGDKAFFVFVLSCRTPEERDRERGALLELLDSFTYIGRE